MKFCVLKKRLAECEANNEDSRWKELVGQETHNRFVVVRAYERKVSDENKIRFLFVF